MKRHHKGLSFYKKKKKISAALLREILSWVFGIFAAVFIAAVTVYAVGMTTGMIGVSMEPELTNGQTVLINRYAYLIITPKAGDVVAFLPNGNHNSHYYIKRVVAGPGDQVQILDGRLYINGVEVSDDYDKMADAGIAKNRLTLGGDEYFVLGDNRNDSEDSRSANIGIVNGNDIVGKVWFHMGINSKKMGFVK
ncbi:MAG TPA: signal peptidase I [Lachnospiraceae bacterium]|nr:signal peptidase I [Lachnospiraceae bacterium]